MHATDVQINAASAAGGGFHGGAGESGGAQVLQGVDFAGGQGFQAGFNEGFLQEGVAYLHGGAAFLVVAVIVRKGPGSQAGSAVDAVPAGAGAGEEQQVARRVGGGAGEVVDFGDAHAHSVDQRIAGVGFVKADFAGHVGDADAVAVPGDAVHDAAQQPAVVGVVRGAKTEGVKQGDGAGAHGEDVADDAAHAGGGALQGFYGGGVVVGFHFEHDRQAVADVDGAGVFRAGPGQDAGGAGGQHSQQGAGVFVAAVFAPQGAEHPQFHRVGFPAQQGYDAAVLGGGEGDFVQYFFANRHSTSPGLARGCLRRLGGADGGMSASGNRI